MLFSDSTHDDVDVAWNSTAALPDEVHLFSDGADGGGQNEVEIDGDGFQDVIDAINLLHDGNHDGPQNQNQNQQKQQQQDVQSTDKRRQIIMSSLFVSLMICYVAFCYYYNRRGKSRGGGGSDGSNRNGSGSGSGNNQRDSQSRQRRRADVQSVLDESSSAVHRARENAEEQRKLKERKEKIKESLFLRLIVEEEHTYQSEGEKEEAMGSTERGEEEKQEEQEEEFEPNMELAEGKREQEQTEENLMEEGMAKTMEAKESDGLDGNDDDKQKQTALTSTSPVMDSDKNTSSAVTSPSSSISFLSSFSSKSKSTTTPPATSITSPSSSSPHLPHSSEAATPVTSAAAPQCPTPPTCTNFKRYTDALQASLHSCQSRHGSTIDCSNNGSIACNYYSNGNNSNNNNNNNNGRHGDQPTISISAMIHTQGEECNICLSSFQVGDRAAWTKKGGCVHAFHEECISKWLLVREGCPMCRRSFLLEERESGDGDGNGEEGNIHSVHAENADFAVAGEGFGMDVGGNATGAAVRDLESGRGVTGIVAVEEEDDEDDQDDEGQEEILEAMTASAPATMIKVSSQ